jgi:hypothetical protein
MDTGLDQRPGYPGCDIHAGVNLVSQTRVPTGKRGREQAVPSDGLVERCGLARGRGRTSSPWTAIVRSDREASARTTGGAAPLGGVGFPWLWSVAARAALLVAIAFVVQGRRPQSSGETRRPS